MILCVQFHFGSCSHRCPLPLSLSAIFLVHISGGHGHVRNVFVVFAVPSTALRPILSSHYHFFGPVNFAISAIFARLINVMAAVISAAMPLLFTAAAETVEQRALHFGHIMRENGIAIETISVLICVKRDTYGTKFTWATRTRRILMNYVTENMK